MYSLCGPASAATYRIGVKREALGIGSQYLHQNLKADDFIEASAPRGTFLLADDPAPLVLLSAGVGITPMLAMLHAAISNAAATPREVWWIHSAQNFAHHRFATEILRLTADVQAAHVVRIFSRPGKQDQRGRDFEESGHIDLAMLQRLGITRNGDFYLCGPSGYLADLSSTLLMGCPNDAGTHGNVRLPC